MEKDYIKDLTDDSLNSHEDYLREAIEYASANSDDKFSKIGAILIMQGPKKIIKAANILPGTVVKTEERCDRPLKYQYLEHAERTAIYRACANGLQIQGATMYSPYNPCVDCARAIISVGIEKVYCLKYLRDATPPRWEESVRLAESMLIESGV